MAKRVQGSEEGDANDVENLPDDADRALATVSSKLDTKLSVEYTVNQLIQEATDPHNLSRIFHGGSIRDGPLGKSGN
jgi:ataxia telangiectasia mutated family protein